MFVLRTDAQVLQRLRTLTQGTYPTLESVDWRLHIQVLVPCQNIARHSLMRDKRAHLTLPQRP